MHNFVLKVLHVKWPLYFRNTEQNIECIKKITIHKVSLITECWLIKKITIHKVSLITECWQFLPFDNIFTIIKMRLFLFITSKTQVPIVFTVIPCNWGLYSQWRKIITPFYHLKHQSRFSHLQCIVYLRVSKYVWIVYRCTWWLRTYLFIYFKTHEFKQKQKQPPRISRSYKKSHLKQPCTSFSCKYCYHFVNKVDLLLL